MAADADVQSVLVDLAVTAQKYGMYPRDHPQLRVVGERLSARLAGVLARRGSLALAVGLDVICLDGASAEGSPPIVRDLARKLRDHQIGAVTFYDGVAWHEIERFLGAVAADPAASPAIDAAPFGPNLLVRPAGFDRIAIGRPESRTPEGPDPEVLWAELARAALRDPPYDGAADVALALDNVAGDARYRRRVAGCLARVIEALAARKAGGRGHAVAHRVSDLLGQVRPETLHNLVWLEGDATARAALLRSAASTIQPDALTILIRAVGEAGERDVSRTVLRVLGKISSQLDNADAVAARLASAELQAGIGRLLSDWHLADPNPDSHNALLEESAFQAAEARGNNGLPPVGVDERLLRICMDLDVWADGADRAADRLLDAGDAVLLLGLLQEAGTGPAAHGLAQRALTPRALRILTAGEEVDRQLLERVAHAMGNAAITPLLDALADSRSRTVRRTLFDALASLGPPVVPEALERAHDGRWYVRRNMLALIARVGPVPDSAPIRGFVGDPDPRVRIQALSIAAGHPDAETAFAAALADPEPRVVVAALRNLPEALPAAFVEPLGRIAEGNAAEDTRLLAVRALGRIRAVRACHALIHIASPGRTWFGRVRVRHDRVATEAVHALAHGWRDSRDARPVLRAAGALGGPRARPEIEERA